MDTQALSLLFALMTHTFNLPTGLQPAVCWVESGYNINAVHHDDGGGNSTGVCQIKLSTARAMGFKGTESELQVPKTNVYYSAKYLNWQLHRYRGNYSKAIAAYNAGTWRVNDKGQIKNRHYVIKVFAAWSKGL